ncbi:HTTM domain-containing protein [Flagellimonas sp. S174]|uniref:HTTM domain-containing protein n=1 Tax=Flagellimonas sp. S174 TaxID=3410790 RepID=UPI003BF5E2D0
MKKRIEIYLSKNAEAASLAVFRIFFGIMMVWSVIRFWYNGWIESLYLEPKFHFSYYGFEWVKPFGNWTYLLFILCGLASIFVLIGYKYRVAIVTFFLCFTYIELMDKTTYLNHYYFISILSFLLIFIPANAYFSVDAKLNPKKRFQFVPKWNVDAIKLLLAIVYVYAGLAKLNSDWLLDATPLRIWLPSKTDLPLIGELMGYRWVHYGFSWFGALYDLTIPFFLLYKPTRWVAFFFVVVFHVMTRILFNIGMFPYIMIVSSLIFFSSGTHHRILQFFATLLRINKSTFDNAIQFNLQPKLRKRLVYGTLTLFFSIQLLLPWRYLAYPGELFWTEEGYRFSWRVMLVEKAGYSQFKIVDGKSGKWFYVDNSDFLTPFQEKQMSFQPDFILEYAHYLKNHFESQGHKNIEVYVESYVTLNGRRSTDYIDTTINLVEEKESFHHKKWIIPFKDDIKGI